MGKIKVRLKYTQIDGRSTFEIGYTKLHYTFGLRVLFWWLNLHLTLNHLRCLDALELCAKKISRHFIMDYYLR